MANARFKAWGESPRTPRRVQLALFIPLICFLLIGMSFVYHIAPFGHTRSAQASTLVTLPGHVPGLEKSSALQGPADPATPIQVLVGFRLRNQQMLKSYVDSMSRPHSVTAHRYLTPAQIARAFAPSQANQSAVIAYLQQAGFTVTQTYKHQLAVGFKGTIGQAESAFHIQINNYLTHSGRLFYAPGRDPSVPANLAPFIQSIIGLDDARQFTHPPVLSNTHVTASVAGPHNVSCLAAQPGPTYSYYLPGQLATAYNLTSLYGAGFHGEGQTVALLELDDYNASDISAYTSCYGGASVPITRILVNGGTGKPASFAATEVELDMEVVLSAAPRLADLRVYESANTSVGYLANLSQIISDTIPVVSTSWGSCESSAFAQAVYTQENTLFTAAAAQLRRVVDEVGIERIRLAFVDQHGLLRGKTLTREAVAGALRDGIRAPSSLLLKDSSGRTVFPVFSADVGVGVEGNERYPSPAMVPGHPGGVGERDRVVAAQDDRDGARRGHRLDHALQPADRPLGVGRRHHHVAEVGAAQLGQRVHAQRQVRPGPVVRQVVGHPQRLRLFDLPGGADRAGIKLNRQLVRLDAGQVDEGLDLHGVADLEVPVAAGVDADRRIAG